MSTAPTSKEHEMSKTHRHEKSDDRQAVRAIRAADRARDAKTTRLSFETPTQWKAAA